MSCEFEAAEVASLVADLRGAAAAEDKNSGAYLLWWASQNQKRLVLNLNDSQ